MVPYIIKGTATVHTNSRVAITIQKIQKVLYLEIAAFTKPAGLKVHEVLPFLGLIVLFGVKAILLV